MAQVWSPEGATARLKDASGTPEKRVHILSLHDDVMLCLLSYLTLPEAFQAEKVCRRWRLLCHTYWTLVKYLDLGGTHVFEAGSGKNLRRVLSGKRPHLCHLKYDCNPERKCVGDIKVIAQHCTNLTHLSLCGGFFTDLSLRALGKSCTRLQYIHLGECSPLTDKGLAWLFSYCKDLKHVSLTNIWGIEGQCFEALSRNVETLLLPCCFLINQLGFGKIAQLQNLRHLDLQGCDELEDGELEAIASGCKKLKVLALSLSNKSTPVGWYSIGRLLELEQLQVVSHVSVDIFLKAIGRCGQLRVLDVRTFFEDTSTGFEKAGKLQAVELLEKFEECHGARQRIDNRTWQRARADRVAHFWMVKNGYASAFSPLPVLGDNALEALARGCSQLRELKLSSGLKLTPKGLAYVARLHELEKLHVPSWYVDDVFLEAITRQCNRLRELDLRLSELTAAGLSYVGRLHALETLHLPYGSPMNDSVLEDIVRGCSNLRVLFISGCKNITPVGYRKLERLHSLEILNLCHSNQAVDDTVLVALGRGCRQLRKLTITGSDRRVTDLGIKALKWCNPLKEEEKDNFSCASRR